MKQYKRMTLNDRKMLEVMYEQGLKPVDIAGELGVNRATVYNELRRGDTGKMDANGRIGYSAELAQNRIYNRRRAAATARAPE